METPQQNLKAYFDKVLDIQQQQENQPLSEAELKSIALNLGITEADWQAIQKAFEDYRTRALGYLQHQNWQDAIPELEQALTLRPADVSALFGMAQAWYFKWQISQQQNDARMAEQYAKKSLQIQPNHPNALRLVSQLKNPHQKAQNNRDPHFFPQKNPTTSSQKPNKLVPMLLVLLLVTGVAGFLLIQVRNPASTSKFDKTEPETSAEAPLSSASSSIDEGENAIPVLVQAGELHNKVRFEVESAILKPYDKSYTFELKADLIPDGIEIDKLNARIELIDAAGKVIASKNEEFIKDYMPIIRNGDIHPVYFSIFKQNTTVPVLREASIRFTLSAHENAPARYEASPEIPHTWAFEKPANFDLKIRERISSYENIRYAQGKTRHELVLEIENTGNTSFKGLNLLVTWRDAQGKILAEKEDLVSFASMPKLKRGQTRLAWYFETLPVPRAQIKNYEVSVIEVE
ncbi:MAG: tetratricopeptide repeat protein [Microscillaceae bacterium]|nr:tetratricopeptide repeat protein [Microscillaceae bacterium]